MPLYYVTLNLEMLLDRTLNIFLTYNPNIRWFKYVRN